MLFGFHGFFKDSEFTEFSQVSFFDLKEAFAGAKK
jgi:hypothetical protein